MMTEFLQSGEVLAKTADVMQIISEDKMETLLKELINYSMIAGKNILLAVVIYFIGKFAINLVNKIVNQMLERKNVDATIKSFLRSFVNILLTILLAITVVSALGVNTTSFAALLASIGVAAGMALSGNLQNLAGGIIILLLKPFKVGDLIEAQGTTGTVKEIQTIHTILLTSDNKLVFLPNGSLSSGNIINYNKMMTRRVDFTIGVEYGTDVDKVLKALKNLAENDKRVLPTPAPLFVLSELADSSVNYSMRLWVKSEDYNNVYFDMTRKIYEEFNKQGIGFPFPQLQIHNT